MQLLVVILKHADLVTELCKELAEEGVHGGTIIDGTGVQLVDILFITKIAFIIVLFPESDLPKKTTLGFAVSLYTAFSKSVKYCTPLFAFIAS